MARKLRDNWLSDKIQRRTVSPWGHFFFILYKRVCKSVHWNRTPWLSVTTVHRELLPGWLGRQFCQKLLAWSRTLRWEYSLWNHKHLPLPPSTLKIPHFLPPFHLYQLCKYQSLNQLCFPRERTSPRNPPLWRMLRKLSMLSLEGPRLSSKHGAVSEKVTCNVKDAYFRGNLMSDGWMIVKVSKAFGLY